MKTFAVGRRGKPFGALRYSSGVTPTDYQYTGQRSAETGLYHYGARWYDPALGRFISADTIVPDPGSAMGYDRYAYVKNSPLMYTDPSGHFEACADGDWACQTHWDYPVVSDNKKYSYDTGLNEGQVETLHKAEEILLPIFVGPIDWMMTYESCTQGDCSPFMLIGLLPGIPFSAGRQVSKLYDIVRFSEKVPGLVGHHGLLDKWARVNIPRYISYNAPVVLLDPLQHMETFKIFNTWKKEVTGSVIGAIDWKNVSPQAMQDLTTRMFDAAGVPQEVQRAYFRAVMKYLYEEVQ